MVHSLHGFLLLFKGSLVGCSSAFQLVFELLDHSFLKEHELVVFLLLFDTLVLISVLSLLTNLDPVLFLRRNETQFTLQVSHFSFLLNLNLVLFPLEIAYFFSEQLSFLAESLNFARFLGRLVLNCSELLLEAFCGQLEVGELAEHGLVLTLKPLLPFSPLLLTLVELTRILLHHVLLVFQSLLQLFTQLLGLLLESVCLYNDGLESYVGFNLAFRQFIYL